MAKAWNTEEISILMEQYLIIGNCKKLGEMLPNRTYNGIQQKAASLKLKVLKPWNKLKTTSTYSSELSARNISVLGTYINSITKILHECNICGTKWEATPGNVVRGTGCPKCARIQDSAADFEKDIKAKLYVLKITLIDKVEFIKVGITRSISNNRINGIKYEIGLSNIIDIKEIVVLEDKLDYILNLESKILRNKNLVRFTSDLRFSGYTETFKVGELPSIIDILLENL